MSGPGEQVVGPIVELAAKVKRALEEAPDACEVVTSYGAFYVSRIELAFSDGQDPCGYLAPDEADGTTFDLYLPPHDGGVS